MTATVMPTRTQADPAPVRRHLDLNLHHLPYHLAVGNPIGLPQLDIVEACEIPDRGWLLYVPKCPRDWTDMGDEPIPETVLAIQDYARANDCDYVLFDINGDRVADLEWFDW